MTKERKLRSSKYIMNIFRFYAVDADTGKSLTRHH